MPLYVTTARRILCWIKAKKQHEVSIKDTRRDGLGGAPDALQTFHLSALAKHYIPLGAASAPAYCCAAMIAKI
jgi:hypothetical protein